MNNRSLHEPDVLITQQFLVARRHGVAVCSEKRLMMAVLMSALHDYQDFFLSRDSTQAALSQEAAEWIECRLNEHMFSFENISETLGFDAEYLRRGITAWRTNHLLSMEARPAEPRTIETQSRA